MMSKRKIYKTYVKRVLDIFFASLALVVLSPVLLITSLLVAVKLGRPVVFKQARPGMNEKIFYLYKFRSMTNEIGEDGRLLPDSQRLTKFGKFLRASSLDELLELINIIKGDMSIVGPRPLSIYYLPHYPKEYRRRHEVRPGLTGLAQVRGRNNLPWDDRFDLDIKYIDNVSFGLDVKIIFETVLKVLKHEGVSVRGTAKVTDYGPYSILKTELNGGQKVSDMTYSEIGSYFWLDESTGSNMGNCSWMPDVNDQAFTFSGRNAIDVAIKDIVSQKKITRALFPSYSCVSMLQAFIDMGIKTEFYDVDFKDGKFTYQIPEADSNTIVLIMSYFGLDTEPAHKLIESLHNKGAVVIEDITHSLLCNTPDSGSSDYLVASLRKWFGIPTGGWIGKRNGQISATPDMDSNHAVTEKIDAMREKLDYIQGRIDSKEHFLLALAKFENDLIHVDRMLKIDDYSMSIINSLNIDKIVDIRRNNVKVLLEGLKDLDGKILTLPKVDLEKDVPLFLPVFLETEKRDLLRKYLIDRGIYCPVHWPEIMGASIGLRANELSLICDQRYNAGDMIAISEAIHSWYQDSIKN